MKNTDCEFNEFSLSFYTPDEIRKLSVKEITSFISIEPILGKGAINGLYDSKLGSLNERDPCITCNLPFFECNGHFGRIEFAKPVYNPILFNSLYKFIKGICFYCHKFSNIQGLPEILYSLGLKEMENHIKKFNDLEEFNSLSYGAKLDRALLIISQAKKDSSKCSQCGKINLLFNKSRKAEILVHISSKLKKESAEPEAKKIKLDETDLDLDKPILNDKYESAYSTKEMYGLFKKEEVVIMPEILREHLRYLWINESTKIKLILPFLSSSNFKFPTDSFFMENMLVNPPMNRLPAVMHGEKLTEGPETANLGLVIKANMTLMSILNTKSTDISDEQRFQNIREGILEIQQRLNTCFDSSTHKNLNNAQPALRQNFDRKQGKIRSNVNGKRVNFACRSVISPDPNIGLDEIGVPVIFLKKLTFEEPMNHLNKDYLRQCIINGPDEYPGAFSYQINDKGIITIKNQREVTANHLESMVQRGNKVVIARHAMDGDYLIMNRQPTLHRPSMQAHKICAILDPKAKTLRMNYSNCKAYNADFDGDEMNGHFMQSVVSQTEAKILVNCANQHSTPKDGSPLAGLIQDHVIAGTRICMRNCFLERHEYFDLIKFGLRNNYVSPMKILPPAIIFPKRLWTGKQVLSTILMNSIPHGMEQPNIALHEPKKNALWKVSEEELRLKLSDVDLVILDGYVCTGSFDKTHIGPSQKGLCNDLRELYGNECALQILTNISRCLNRYLIYTGFSTDIKDGFLNKEADTMRNNIADNMKFVGLASITKTFNIDPRNFKHSSLVQLMEKAQFDKSDDFKNRMSEIDLNFKKFSNKCTNDLNIFCRDNMRENFPSNNLLFMANTGAKGGDSNVKKIAVLLGAIEIEGKRTPLTISGKTLPSFVRYDFNPLSRGFCMSRFTSGLKPQELFFESMAGRDGLVDTAVKTSSSGYLQRCLIKQLEDISVRYDGTVRDNTGNIIQFKYGYDGLDVIKSMATSSIGNMEVICRNLDHFKHRLIEPTKKLLKIGSDTLTKGDLKNIDDLVKKMSSEQIVLTGKQKKLLQKIISVKILAAQCEPGEAVGLVAAQSVGEPSTQMTLNTFHNAGQSEMNVTLGIPRLREILMIGSESIKTPSMMIPILTDKTDNTIPILKEFTKLRLKDVINLPLKFEVNENYVITFSLKNSSDYKHLTHLRVSQVIKRIEEYFFKLLGKTIKKYIENSNIDITSQAKEDDGMEIAAVAEDKEGEADDNGNVAEELEDSDDDGDSVDSSDDEPTDENDEDVVADAMDDDDAKENAKPIDATRKMKVLDFSTHFVNYEVDGSKTPRWLKLTIKLTNAKVDLHSLLLNLIQNSLISETKGVDKAVVMKTKKGDFFCTEGFNYLEVFKYDQVFDLNQFNTNNIVKMSRMYGVEAAISSIEHEVKKVFAPYSIEISNRHLRLIAEYMTFSGKASAFNRHSMKYHSSQLQRCSFETALDTLCDMVFKANADSLKSPTSNLIMGQVVSNIGSNCMELLYNRN